MLKDIDMVLYLYLHLIVATISRLVTRPMKSSLSSVHLYYSNCIWFRL